jgi:hypothetical protein
MTRTRLTRGRKALLLCTAALTFVAAPLPARAADPVLMFFLGFARNLLESHLEANAPKAPAAPIVAPQPAPPEVAYKAPGSMTNDDLRAVVNDSFAYLNRQQRAELLDGLEKTLADPALAAQRDIIVGEFMTVARQVGFTHRQLDRLSRSQKQALANQFAANYRSLPLPEQQRLAEHLRMRALPLPEDLHDMMMTALTSPP